MEKQKNLSPTHYVLDCEHPLTREDSSVCAEWTAAVAARDSASWDRYNFNAASLGAAGVFLSLVVSALAAWAAFRALRVSQVAEVTRNRAYVFVDSVGIADGTHHPERDPALLGTVGSAAIPKNSGQTPAHDVVHWSVVDIAPVVDEAKMQFPEKLEMRSPSVVPPGGTITAMRLMPRPTSAEEIEGIKRGSIAVFVYGRITYKDVYGFHRRTDYRLFYTGSWPPAKDCNLSFCNRGNSST